MILLSILLSSIIFSQSTYNGPDDISGDPSAVKESRMDGNRILLYFKNTTQLSNWEPPRNNSERINLQLQIKRSMNGGPDERLKAIQISSHWRHPSVLRFLRQGLRDSDSRVVHAAAEALSRLKGKYKPEKRVQEGKPPHNVSLMR